LAIKDYDESYNIGTKCFSEDFREYYSTGHPFKVLKEAIIMSRIHVVLS
jgi:hypothetical protein